MCMRTLTDLRKTLTMSIGYKIATATTCFECSPSPIHEALSRLRSSCLLKIKHDSSPVTPPHNRNLPSGNDTHWSMHGAPSVQSHFEA